MHNDIALERQGTRRYYHFKKHNWTYCDIWRNLSPHTQSSKWLPWTKFRRVRACLSQNEAGYGIPQRGFLDAGRSLWLSTDSRRAGGGDPGARLCRGSDRKFGSCAWHNLSPWNEMYGNYGQLTNTKSLLPWQVHKTIRRRYLSEYRIQNTLLTTVISTDHWWLEPIKTTQELDQLVNKLN